MTIATTSSHVNIPPFHFPKGGNSTPKHEQYILNTIVKVRQLFNYQLSLSESQFIPIAEVCGLPRYLNMAFFRKLENIGNIDMRVTLSAFIEGWTNITRESNLDEESLFFNILKKPNSQWISPDDFLTVLEDVVINHPGLRFLSDNTMFQERYIETVICRIFYDGNCSTGRMNLIHFRKSGFVQMIKNLGPEVDLNNTGDCFSYKHFYVLYCKFWVLDEDHDLIISENDLLNYNDGILSQRVTQQVMRYGCIPAFSKMENSPQLSLNEINTRDNKLTYIDYIWFLLSETDKSTNTAIEYWFRCLDEDSDGVITTYDLAEHWNDQDRKLQDIIEDYTDERILFDDLIRQMNDLIRPEIAGQFRLKDLKRNGIIAERFFDTFINIEKFQIHDTYQGLIRSIAELQKQMSNGANSGNKINNLSETSPNEQMAEVDLEKGTIVEQESKQISPSQEQYQQPFSLGSWCEYAEQEYDLLILSEQCGYVSSEWSVKDEYEEDLNSNITNSEGEENEIDSPTSSSSGDHESDSSAPSTPVMQDPAVDSSSEERWIEGDSDKNSIEQNGKLTGWIWHSADT